MLSIPNLQKVSEFYLEEYNAISNAPMNLVLFLDAIEHTSRICRVIRLPLGNALLLGVGGSGRQSLTRLATFVEEFDIFQVLSIFIFYFFLPSIDNIQGMNGFHF